MAAQILAAWHEFDHGYGPDPDEYIGLNFRPLLITPRPTLSFHDGTTWLPDEDETDLNATDAKPINAIFVAVTGDAPNHATVDDLLLTATTGAVYWTGSDWDHIPFPYNPNFVLEWNDHIGRFATRDTTIGGRDDATILAGLRDLAGPWRAFMWDADERVLDTDVTLDAFNPDDPTTVPAGISIVRGDSLPFAPGVRVSFENGPSADTLYDVDVDADDFPGEWSRAVALADMLSKFSAAIAATGLDL